MAVVETKTFQSGNSEAVRLPRDIAFGVGTTVTLERVGDVVTIRPAKKSLAWLIEQLRTLPKPDGIQAREPFEFPDRPGL